MRTSLKKVETRVNGLSYPSALSGHSTFVCNQFMICCGIVTVALTNRALNYLVLEQRPSTWEGIVTISN